MMAASHVDLLNCTRLAEWLEEHDRMPNAAQLAKSLRAVMAGFIAATDDPTPGPATKAMLAWVKKVRAPSPMFQAFLAEWADPATPPAPEQPAPATPWTCSICGEPVRIGDDLRPYHLDGPANHDAELSDEDLKILADGLRLTD